MDAMSIVLKATAKLKDRLPTATAGGMVSAGAAGSDVFRRSAIEALTESGLSRERAEQIYDANAELIGGEMARQVYQTGNQKLIEPMEKALDLADRVHGLDLRQDRAQLAEQFKRNLTELGISGLDKKTLESVRNVLKNTDPRVLALAAAQAAGKQEEIERIQASYRRSNKDEAKGNIAFLQASRAAAGLVQGQDKSVQGAIRQIGERGQGNLEQRIREAGFTVGADMARQAFETTAQRLAEDLGDSRIAGSANTRDLMERLRSHDSLGGIKNKAQRAAIEAWRTASRRGDEKGMATAERSFEAAALETGAKGGVEIFGGGQSGTAEIDRQIADLQEAKTKFAKDSPEDKSQTLFASSVELFAQAAKDLKSATENIALSNVANPKLRDY
jgi:hypothetical protein